MNLDSILDSIKSLLGLDPECSEEFDADLISNINSAIFTLKELGVNPVSGYGVFTVTGRGETFTDYLGENNPLTGPIRTYIFRKVKLAFDTPTIGAVLESLKEQIREDEWRIREWVDPEGMFEDY